SRGFRYVASLVVVAAALRIRARLSADHCSCVRRSIQGQARREAKAGGREGTRCARQQVLRLPQLRSSPLQAARGERWEMRRLTELEPHQKRRSDGVLGQGRFFT